MTSKALDAWRRYWFTPAPLFDLGVARACLAGVLLLLTGTTRYHAVGHGWQSQWDPVEVIEWLGLSKPDLATMELLGTTTAALLVLAGIGLFARLALLAVLPLFFFQEALLMSFGKTAHATIPLLYALLFFALAPCDRRFALGATLRRALGRAAPAPETSAFARWPLDLLYVVLSGFYFSAAVSKLTTSGPRWADGLTLQYHLLHKGVPLGLALAEHLWLCALASAAVLVWQLSFPLGIARGPRPVLLAGGVAFHLGTGLAMDVWFWPVPALYLVFVPWSRVAGRLARPREGLRPAEAARGSAC